MRKKKKRKEKKRTVRMMTKPEVTGEVMGTPSIPKFTHP